jgi:hypothetical protein
VHTPRARTLLLPCFHATPVYDTFPDQVFMTPGVRALAKHVKRAPMQCIISPEIIILRVAMGAPSADCSQIPLSPYLPVYQCVVY